jgi:uncharacterized Zn-finger protein
MNNKSKKKKKKKRKNRVLCSGNRDGYFHPRVLIQEEG